MRRVSNEGGDWKPWWALGALVVAIAASLLITLIAYGRRIVRQADEITESLDRTARNTDAMFALAGVNNLVEQATDQLRNVREGASAG